MNGAQPAPWENYGSREHGEVWKGLLQFVVASLNRGTPI